MRCTIWSNGQSDLIASKNTRTEQLTAICWTPSCILANVKHFRWNVQFIDFGSECYSDGWYGAALSFCSSSKSGPCSRGL